MTKQQKLAAFAIGAPIAWAAYSALVIDHDVPLPEAFPGRLRRFTAPTTGELGYYEDPGPVPGSNAPPVVLLHSINAAASSDEMRPLFAHYRERRRVLALDLPGFGFSERSERRYEPELYTSAIIEFLEGVVGAAGGADIVALSLASEFAALVALRRPELVRRLVFLSPTGLNVTPQPLQRARAAGYSDGIRRALDRPPHGQALFDLLVSRPSIRYFLEQQTVGPSDAGLREYSWRSAHQPGARHAPLAFLAGELFTPDILEHAYARVTPPVLVLHDRSVNTTFDALPSLLERRSNWHAVRIGPAKDLVHFDRPTAVVEAIDVFWQAQLEPAEVEETTPAPTW